MAPLLIARTRAILWICLFAGVVFCVLELAVAPHLAPPFLVKCAGVSLIGATLLLLHQPWAVRHAQAVTLVIICGGYLLTAFSGIVSPSREYSTTAVAFVAAALMTATVMPWGVWPQAISVVLAVALLCGAVLWADGSLAVLSTDPAAAVGVAFVLSLVTAREIQRHRLASRRATVEIRALNADLEQRVAERTRELQAANERLRGLSARLESVREEARTRIAHEVQEELGQTLTALKIDLDLLRKHLATAGLGAAGAPVQRTLATLSGVAQQTIDSVRRIAAELRPSLLDDLGLPAALEWQALEFQRRSGVLCSFVCEPRTIALDPARATALFRIVQDTLTNVAHHREITRIVITLRQEVDYLSLEMYSDAPGTGPAELFAPDSLDMDGIRERVRSLHGDVDVHRVPQKGTTVRLRVPHQAVE